MGLNEIHLTEGSYIGQSHIECFSEDMRKIITVIVFGTMEMRTWFQVIEHVTAYRPLLTTIKKEYEDTIEAIKKAQREATFLHGKLKAMASEPSTIRNYKKRADELGER